MIDLKNSRYVEPVPFTDKLVYGGAFIAVLLALIFGACL